MAKISLILRFLVMLAGIAGLGACKDVPEGHSKHKVEQRSSLLVTAQPAAKPSSSRAKPVFTTELVYDKALLAAVELYLLKFGDMPRSPKDVSSLTFFSIPAGLITEWNVEGEKLTVGRNLPETARTFGTPDQPITRTPFYKPGSRAYADFYEKVIKEHVAIPQKLAEANEDGQPKLDLHAFPYTEEDIREGRFPLFEVDLLRLHARNPQELLQLHWSKKLAVTLLSALIDYNRIYGHYPKTFDEVFKVVGEPNPAAWIPPMGKSPVGVVGTWNGKDVVYRVKEDLTGFEVLVPLYGAGSREPIVSGAFRQLTPEHYGYYAGQFFKATGGTKGFTPSII